MKVYRLCSKLNILGAPYRTFGGICLVQKLATKSQSWWQESLTGRQKWYQKFPLVLIKSLSNRPNSAPQEREGERTFEFNLKIKLKRESYNNQTGKIWNMLEMSFKWQQRKTESRNWWKLKDLLFIPHCVEISQKKKKKVGEEEKKKRKEKCTYS